MTQKEAEEAENAAAKAQKAAEKAEAVAEEYKKAEAAQKAADGKLKEYEEVPDWNIIAKNEARDAYYIAADEAVNARIRCVLAEEGVTEVTIGEWEKNSSANNYVEVAYEKDGVLYREYYDYTGDIADPHIVKKTPLYESDTYKGFTFPLDVSVEDGEVKYKFNGEEVVPEEYAGDTASITLPVESKEYIYKETAISKEKALLAVTICGETRYYQNGKEVDVEFKNGKLYKVGALYIVDGGSATEGEAETLDCAVSFTKTKAFNGKGTPVPNALTKNDVTAEAVVSKKQEAENAKATAETKAEDARNAKATAETKAEEAKTAKQTAETKAEEAVAVQELLNNAKTVAAEAAGKKEEADRNLAELNQQLSVLKNAIEKLQGEIGGIGLSDKKAEADEAGKTKKEKDELVKEQEAKYNKAKGEADIAKKRAEDANEINTSVEKAYNKVVSAIESLKDLTAEENVNAAEYKKVVAAYDKAVSEFEDALEAKGISGSNLARISAAAERARAAADAVFAYESPAPSGGNEGGTTGGGTTGGGGTAGGGTTTTPPAVPVVTLPEEGVPLAGEGMTNPMAAGRAAGVSAVRVDGTGAADGTGTALAGGDERTGGELTVLEDEETPLASLEDVKETGTAVIEDEETPLAAPIEEQSRMSWWWLLLIAALGVTGEEMYRRHRKKAAEAEKMNS